MEILGKAIWPRSYGTPVAELKDYTLIFCVALEFFQPLSPRSSIHGLLLFVFLGNKPHSQDQLQSVKMLLK